MYVNIAHLCQYYLICVLDYFSESAGKPDALCNASLDSIAE